jgi:hypothetical protein
MRYTDFWTVLAILSLIFCAIAGVTILARITYLVVKGFKEKPEEQAAIGKRETPWIV